MKSLFALLFASTITASIVIVDGDTCLWQHELSTATAMVRSIELMGIWLGRRRPVDGTCSNENVAALDLFGSLRLALRPKA